MPDSKQPGLDMLLLTSTGQESARFSGVQIGGTSARELTQAARERSGKAVWLLHDGGAGMHRRDFPARFELLDGGISGIHPAPSLLHARPWQRVGWRSEALSWMEAHTAQAVSDVAWVHTSDVGAVLTAQAGELGRIYLKAGEDGREASAAVQIAAKLPELMPQVLAADVQRGWLLTRDAGSCLLESSELSDWLTAVQKLAQVQRLARLEGVPPYPFAALPEQVDGLLTPEILNHWGLSDETQTQIQSLQLRLRQIHAQISALGLPECPCHGDFHANNVLVGTSGVRLFDFSEACAAHPFTDIGWFLAFIMHPMRQGLKLRQAAPELGERLWNTYLDAMNIRTRLRWPVSWRDAALLAIFHRAVVYDAKFRGWVGTLPGFQPQYVPYSLKTARLFGPEV